MMWRPGAVALARMMNGLFCLAASSYCLLAYSPFAYDQFIKPNTVPAITDFVALSPWLFWVALLTTILTFMPQLRGAPGRGPAWTYVVTGLAAGALVVARPPLERVGHTSMTFAVGLLALVSPAWLAVIDHRLWAAVKIRTAHVSRALATCLMAAVVTWAAYAIAVPVRIRQAVGIELTPRMLVVGIAISLVLHLVIFIALFLVVAGAMGVSSVVGRDGCGIYWFLVACLGVCSTVVVSLLVCRSIAFVGWAAWVWSAGFGLTTAAVWANLARLRCQSAVHRQSSAGHEDSPLVSRPAKPWLHGKIDSFIDIQAVQARLETADSIDSLEMFCAPVVGCSRGVASLLLIALPIAAYTLVETVRHLDWNFLLQKLGVLVIWILAFACASAAVRERRRLTLRVIAGVPLAVLGCYNASAFFDIRTALDRYAAVDPSFRLIRDAEIGHSSATAEYYRVLRAETLLAPRDIRSPDVDFVRPLPHASGRQAPNIFMIVVDSLRRDYLSVYNPEVTFTPQVGRLAADSFVFRRVFTRYSGTGLAVPSIWGGGMVPHALDQPQFAKRNTLQKLLDANRYRRIMDVDHVVEPLIPRDSQLEELDRGKRTTELDLCATLDELAQKLQPGGDRPVFFYSLPQNLHIAIAGRRPVPAGEWYPARFYDRIASSLHRIDACLGRFVDFLVRENLYDNSIIIVTADHGDSLGEEGRWGHAYFMYPEVMNIPLIVHLPSWLRTRVRADLDAVAFSTDITPSLYALLGYAPNDLGPLFGRPLFAAPGDNTNLRRHDGFLLASSYGAVYGILRQNGRRMHVVDAVDGQEFAFDLSASPQPVVVTPATSAANRRVIAEQIAALSAIYRNRR